MLVTTPAGNEAQTDADPLPPRVNERVELAKSGGPYRLTVAAPILVNANGWIVEILPNDHPIFGDGSGVNCRIFGRVPELATYAGELNLTPAHKLSERHKQWIEEVLAKNSTPDNIDLHVTSDELKTVIERTRGLQRRADMCATMMILSLVLGCVALVYAGLVPAGIAFMLVLTFRYLESRVERKIHSQNILTAVRSPQQREDPEGIIKTQVSPTSRPQKEMIMIREV